MSQSCSVYRQSSVVELFSCFSLLSAVHITKKTDWLNGWLLERPNNRAQNQLHKEVLRCGWLSTRFSEVVWWLSGLRPPAVFKKIEEKACRVSWLACLPSETPSHTLLLHRRTTATDKLDSSRGRTSKEEPERWKTQVAHAASKKEKETPEPGVGTQKDGETAYGPATADVCFFFLILQSSTLFCFSS